MPPEKGIVLYVEDEEMDRFLMERAFAKCGLDRQIQLATDGREALEYLSGQGPFADRTNHPLPAVVLLDLNLPELHGFEVLKWIRQQPGFATLPVVIFSSSEREEDQVRARQLGANEFIKKPGSGLSFADVVRRLHAKWLDGASRDLPGPSAG